MEQFFCPGAGKTMTSLVVWRYLYLKNKVGKLLVICPKSAFETWYTDEPAATFSVAPCTEILSNKMISRETEILITNYEKLENIQILDRLKKWVIENNSALILDEAHRVKGGGKSMRWIACRNLVSYAKS